MNPLEQTEHSPMTDRATALKSLGLTRRETSTMQVTRKLLDYVLAGHFHPGDRLDSERKLAEAFGIGRSAVREAIKSLELLGLVEVRQGDGTYLMSSESDLLPQVIEWGLLLGAKETLDLIEARRHLEVLFAGLAAERRDESDLAKLRRELDRMHAAGDDVGELTEADKAFHLLIAEAANNEALSLVNASIRSLLGVWMTRVTAATGVAASADQHDPIFRAIAEGDVEAAREAMEGHMEWAVARLQETLEPD